MVLTLNVPEVLDVTANERVLIVENEVPRGFGANHNSAFLRCREHLFCPLNPDVELLGNPFTVLVATMTLTGAAMVAPLVKSSDGAIEDSIRRFPTVFSLARKLFWGDDGRYQVKEGDAIFSPDWVAGMFMLFHSEAFARLRGFDERFFLYYEDVDICARAWEQGMKIIACPQVSVIHDARRASRRSARHLRWHVASLGRYLWNHCGRSPSAVA